MAQCPVCQAEIPDDFGLIECGQCGAQLFVQIDGSVEHANSPANAGGNSAIVHEPEPEPLVPQDDFGFAEPERELSEDLGNALMADLQEEDAQPVPEEDLPPVSFESPMDEEPLPQTDPEPEPEAEVEAPREEPREKRDIFADDFGADEAAPAVDSYRIPGTPADSPDLSDIAKFGNSDASSGRDGALRYKLMIQGIDTSDVREALREALTDRKFIWDTDAILRSIRNGELQLDDVTASKAFMLISRLRSLPVRVKWEQHAIHQP